MRTYEDTRICDDKTRKTRREMQYGSVTTRARLLERCKYWMKLKYVGKLELDDRWV